ncbi:MAG: hypothetical protein KC486_20550 [Myxococcales bacterium]|nr:hypothetical protein [Myxococcales bacterium]
MREGDETGADDVGASDASGGATDAEARAREVVAGRTATDAAALDEQLAGKVTPLEVRLPRGDELSLAIEVSLAGHHSAAERRLPLASENLRFVLRPLVDPTAEARRGKARPIRLSAKPRKAAESEDPLPAPTFEKPLKKRVPDGG